MAVNLRSAGRDDRPSASRMLTLSDNVVAVAMTLLVLQLRVPLLSRPDSASQLATRLAGQSSELVSYLVSFYVIGQFWLAHHRVFRQVAAQREGLAWWNFAFLFTITVMPFSASLIGTYGSNPLAVDIFAANLLLAALATQAILVFGHRRDLLVEETDVRAAQAARARAVTLAGVVVLSAGLAWWNTTAAKYCWLLIVIMPWAANRWVARTHRGTAGQAGKPGR
jgi:uncharacterized membrane protein